MPSEPEAAQSTSQIEVMRAYLKYMQADPGDRLARANDVLDAVAQLAHFDAPIFVSGPCGICCGKAHLSDGRWCESCGKPGTVHMLVEPTDRRRKAKIKVRLRFYHDVKWEPEIDLVTGESGRGLLEGLRIWWRVRRGTWRDDWEPDFYDPSWCIDGHCGACDVCLSERAGDD